MRSIGIELDRRLESDRLTVSAVRSTHLGIETHLVKLEQLVSKLNPSVVVLDAVSDLLNTGSSFAAKSMLIRAIDFLKHRGITTLLTSLVPFASNDATVQISSFIDTWIVLENQAANGVLRRTARIVKSRGMSHSHQLAEFRISDSGLVFRRDDGAAFE
jgi:circadian clock protein KaiC